MMSDFIQVQANLCIGCRTCEIACAQAHDGETRPGGPFYPRLKVVKREEVSAPVMCHQCENAPCVAVCPTGALIQGKQSVEIEGALCIGCSGCVVACPFGVIEIVGHPGPGGIQPVKCDLCCASESGPACVTVCPTAALEKVTGGEVAQKATARRRTTAFPKRGG